MGQHISSLHCDLFQIIPTCCPAAVNIKMCTNLQLIKSLNKWTIHSCVSNVYCDTILQEHDLNTIKCVKPLLLLITKQFLKYTFLHTVFMIVQWFLRGKSWKYFSYCQKKSNLKEKHQNKMIFFLLKCNFAYVHLRCVVTLYQMIKNTSHKSVIEPSDKYGCYSSFSTPFTPFCP